jgi:flavodoxin
MNSLIVYYSLTGHVEGFVEKLKDATGFDTLKLETVSDLQYKGALRYLVGGFQAVTGYNPALKTINVPLETYDHFIFVTPVWAGTYVPAFNALLDQYDFSHKKITVISSSKDPKTKVYEKLDLKLPLSTITRYYKIIDREPEDQKNIVNQLLKQLKNQAQPYE